jgi:hypothetical protein
MIPTTDDGAAVMAQLGKSSPTIKQLYPDHAFHLAPSKKLKNEAASKTSESSGSEYDADSESQRDDGNG